MKILVAIDGSDNAHRALEHAIGLASRMSEPSSLLLANVHDDIALRSASQFVAKESLDAYLAEKVTEETRQAIEIATRAGVKFETRLLRGRISNVITEAAVAEGCDMLVLGSKGRSALKDLLIGSVAQRVIALSTVPVLLVR